MSIIFIVVAYFTGIIIFDPSWRLNRVNIFLIQITIHVSILLHHISSAIFICWNKATKDFVKISKVKNGQGWSQQWICNKHPVDIFQDTTYTNLTLKDRKGNNQFHRNLCPESDFFHPGYLQEWTLQSMLKKLSWRLEPIIVIIRILI